MSISSPTRKAGPYIGNGSANVFPFTFKVFLKSDLYVVTLDTSTGAQTTLTADSDYYVTLNANQESTPGGSITLLAGALATGLNLTITSAMQNLQPTVITNLGGFYPEVINDSLDRLTMLIQQLQVTMETLLSRLAVQPCAVTTPGAVYTAPGDVAAVFVNGSLEPPTSYSAVGPVITFTYALDLGDVVNALCKS